MIFLPERMLSDRMLLNFLQVGHFHVNRSADLVQDRDAVHLSTTGAGHCELEDSSTGQKRSFCVL